MLKTLLLLIAFTFSIHRNLFLNLNFYFFFALHFISVSSSQFSFEIDYLISTSALSCLFASSKGNIIISSGTLSISTYSTSSYSFVIVKDFKVLLKKPKNILKIKTTLKCFLKLRNFLKIDKKSK